MQKKSPICTMDKILIDAREIDLNAPSFCYFLTTAVCANLLVKISEPKKTFQQSLNAIESFLNDPNNSYIKRNCYGTNHLNLRQILRQGAYNIECKNSGGLYSIDINKNYLIPGTFIPIRNICSLVDVGNFEVKGTRMFSNCFKEIEENAGKYVDEFLLGVTYVNCII